jgi:hypothetical protein
MKNNVCRPPLRRPSIETLEDRVVPAVTLIGVNNDGTGGTGNCYVTLGRNAA